MRFKSPFLLLVLSLHVAAVPAQTAASTRAKAPATVSKELPPFSGTWILDNKRSKLIQHIGGESKAIIAYDGKTWHYVHSHQDSPDEEPEQWQTTMVVDSPKYNTVQGADITFHSRIARVGNAMVLYEHGETLHGQKTTNTVRYTLENGGNTLIETETSVGPLGPEHNIYVLNRYGAAPAAAQ
jgi:hypothetical protein